MRHVWSSHTVTCIACGARGTFHNLTVHPHAPDAFQFHPMHACLCGTSLAPPPAISLICDLTQRRSAFQRSKSLYLKETSSISVGRVTRAIEARTGMSSSSSKSIAGARPPPPAPLAVDVVDAAGG